MTIQTPFKTAVAEEDIARLGTAPIPAERYYSEAYFELEREAIFKRAWLQIGHVCEIPEPGSFIVRPLEVAKASILITRGKDGAVRAFHNVCTHRGTQLVDEAQGNRSSFTCRYHAWTFGNDGQLRSAPDFESFYVDQADCSLPSIAVDVCAGLIFINLDPHPKVGLREFLGPMAEQLEARPVARATAITHWIYEIEANWKLTYDNFQENYHLRFVQPNTAALALAPENPFGYPTSQSFFGAHRQESLWANPNAPQMIKPIRQLAFGRAAQFAAADGLTPSLADRDFYCVFPNLFMLGSRLSNFTQTIYPLSPTRTRSVIHMYWIGEDENASERFAREYSMVNARDVMAEDRDIVEAGQQGLSSGALKHIHFQAREVLLRHFTHAVDSAVEAYKAGLNGAEAG